MSIAAGKSLHSTGMRAVIASFCVLAMIVAILAGSARGATAVPSENQLSSVRVVQVSGHETLIKNRCQHRGLAGQGTACNPGLFWGVESRSAGLIEILPKKASKEPSFGVANALQYRGAPPLPPPRIAA